MRDERHHTAFILSNPNIALVYKRSGQADLYSSFTAGKTGSVDLLTCSFLFRYDDRVAWASGGQKRQRIGSVFSLHLL